MKFPAFTCPKHGQTLRENPGGDAYNCPEGCTYPIYEGIPRFVHSDNYAARFGNQWKVYARTQLDSHTGTTITRDRLTRLMGGSLDHLAGKMVAEAGCGAGRFTEVLLEAGANVVAFDLSSAVEACRDNNAPHPSLALAQADLLHPPFAPASFDVVVCIGVVQHTPSSRQTLASLAGLLKPGGMLVFDHYPPEYQYTPSRAFLRKLLLRMPRALSIASCQMLVTCLWPFHSFLYAHRAAPWAEKAWRKLWHVSPVVDYQNDYPQLGPRLLREWAMLDTHDTLTDTYKHLLGIDDLRPILEEIGMRNISLWRGGNGVESLSYVPYL